MQLCSSLSVLCHCLSLGLEWKLTFSSPVFTAEFPNLLTYWVQHFHRPSFSIWNTSNGIPSLPLALFIVMLPKAHLTPHSRMSSSRWVWVITPLWLSGSWKSSLYSSFVYSCHLFLISSASLRSIWFLSFIESIFAWNVPLVSLIFLKRSLVFRKPFSSHLGCFFQKVQDLFKLSILNAYFLFYLFYLFLLFFYSPSPECLFS